MLRRISSALLDLGQPPKPCLDAALQHLELLKHHIKQHPKDKATYIKDTNLVFHLQSILRYSTQDDLIIHRLLTRNEFAYFSSISISNMPIGISEAVIEFYIGLILASKNSNKHILTQFKFLSSIQEIVKETRHNVEIIVKLIHEIILVINENTVLIDLIYNNKECFVLDYLISNQDCKNARDCLLLLFDIVGDDKIITALNDNERLYTSLILFQEFLSKGTSDRIVSLF